MKRVQQISRLHISWHIAALSAGLLVGIALSAFIMISAAASTFWLLGALILVALSLTKRSRRFATLALCAGLAIGLWRGTAAQLALQHYQPFYDKSVTLQGIVSDDVSHNAKGDTSLELTHPRVNGTRLPGKIWLSTATKRTIKRSDTLTLQGKLKTGFGNIPASMSSARLVSVSPTSRGDMALQARDWFAAGIHRAIPDPQASLGSGFIVGQHTSLPSELNNELKVVGLTHAVVASGSNLTILVGFTRRLLLGVSKYTATLAGGLMTAGFIMITGLSPSMTRAGLVTGLSLAAWYYGRRIHPMVLLPFAAAITALFNPSYIWGDIGWCLSFGAFAGVLILAPLIQHYFWGKDYEPNIMMEILIGTTAAQIATMPVILFSFGTYSSYALIANMLVLPLIPFAMLLTFIAGIAGVALPAVAGVIGWPAAMIMRYMTWVIHWVASLPGAQGKIGYGQIALILSYVSLLLLSIYMWRKTSHKFGSETNILIGERP
jgi:competence protein ComEC